MSGYPGSPRIIKGAIVSVDKLTPIPKVIIFQYNPSELSRNLKPRTASSTANKTEATVINGAAQESISVGASIDAADQLELGDYKAATMGIHPQLAALEMLLYPGSFQVIANTLLAAVGTIEIMPPDAPLTLFIWGPRRVLPVKLSSLSITEKNHDRLLNPILADVKLSMEVLTYTDLDIFHPGFYVYLSHQVVKETMANIGMANGF